ncbi:MAG: Rpn family recombination-promoting nuclease/putative transposase [Clostridia bacterium]|nr:Rpn family recombination-promoting nuclease/putative transposase [Lachnospiraceae bacterium]NCC00148.1 Rpn family recombination-promoting nuclease/putative transposase [Clostridia bacterium]NCD01590.1 Rpn family recombination-promoting nuclease/putative transposase [Clostridia bacterium]
MENTQEFIMQPKVDFCFKELMQEDFVRRGFLSALMAVPVDTIQETLLLPNDLRKFYKEDKLGILDVRVLMENGTQIDIEIQVEAFKAWPERSIFYLGKMFCEQIEAGQSYTELKKCIHIGILDFDLFKGRKEFYSCFHLWEDGRHELYSDKMEIHVLELRKLKQYEYPENDLLYWARFLNGENREELEAMSEKNEYLGEAYNKLVNISADRQKRQEYEARQKAIRDHNYLMQSRLEEGREQGLKEGIEITKRVFKLRIEGKSAAEIAMDCGIPENEVEEIIK